MCLLFLILLGIFFGLSGIYEKRLLLDQKIKVQSSLLNYGRSISYGLNQNMAILTVLRDTILANLENPDRREIFNRTAEALYKGKEGIRALQFFPHEGFMYLYPLSNNESVSRRQLSDLINDDRPQVRLDVQRAIDSRKIAISGPYELRQGGLGLVARLAIYDQDHLWGIAVIVFDLPPIFEQAGIHTLPEELELGVKDTTGLFFAGNSQDFSDPMTYSILLPDRSWEIMAQPAGGWMNTYKRELRIFQAVSLLLLCSIMIMVYLYMLHKVHLEQLLHVKSKDLNKSQYLLERTQKIAHIGSWEIELKNKRFNWSDELENVIELDLKNASAPQNLIIDRIPSEERARMIELFKSFKEESCLRFDMEHTFLWGKDKEPRLLREQCEILLNARQEVEFIIGTTEDITDQKRASEELQQAKKQFEQAVMKAPVAMVITDINQDILLFNEKFTQDYGYTLEDVSTAEQWWEQAYPDLTYRKYVQDTWMQAIEKATRGNGEIEKQEFNLTVKDRSVRKVEFTMAVLGEISVIAMNDITRQEELQEELNHRNRLDSLGQLAGGLAHDFNNILNIISNAAQMLEENQEEPEDYIEMIKVACIRASDLTGNLLRFSRKGQKNKEYVNLYALIDETGNILRSSLDKKITLEIVKDALQHHIMGDASALQSAFLNLGINAGHAMEGKGKIQFRLSNIHLSDEDCRNNSFNLKSGDYIRLEIVDTGKGIPQDILPRIFDPFFTTREQGKGTGLGLSAVYGTVREHKGSIVVESKLQIGSTFRILFPVIEKEVADFKTTEDTTSSNGEKVLLVDDEELIRKVVSAQLHSIGYEVILASNGAEALEIFRQQYNELDLVILDMVMPVMDGKEAFVKMKEIHPDCPILISSGYLKDHSIEELMSLGLSGFINKPYTRKELHKTLRRVLEQKNKGKVIPSPFNIS